MREGDSAYITWITNKLQSPLHWWLKEGHVGDSIRFKVYTTKHDYKMLFEDIKNGIKESVSTSSEAFEKAENIMRQEHRLRKFGPNNANVKDIENKIRSLIKKL